MGCDGGSIPTRVELVKVKKKEEQQRENNEFERSRWHCCTLSKEPLKGPVVCCRLGNLYSKEAVILCLLEKSLPPEFSHIRSLKDLTPVNFTPNPAWEEKPFLSYVTTGNGPAPFICPVTGLEVNGHHSFSVLRRCGCVFADRALKEVQSSECLQCREPFTTEDVQPLNPKPEVRELLQKILTDQPKEKRRRHKEQRTEKHEKQQTEVPRKRKKEDKSEKPTHVQKKVRVEEPVEDAAAVSAKHCSAAYRSIFISSTAEHPSTSTFTHYS